MPSTFKQNGGEFGYGLTVAVDGLKAKPELNGRHGKVLGYDSASERYSIEIDGDKVSLKKANLTLLQKMKLYNGKTLPGYTRDNIRELRDESPREGLGGISPRSTLSKTLVHCWRFSASSGFHFSSVKSSPPFFESPSWQS